MCRCLPSHVRTHTCTSCRGTAQLKIESHQLAGVPLLTLVHARAYLHTLGHYTAQYGAQTSSWWVCLCLPLHVCILTCTPLGMALPNRKPNIVAAKLKGRAIWAPNVDGAARVAAKEVTRMAPHAIQWDGSKGEAGEALPTCIQNGTKFGLTLSCTNVRHWGVFLLHIKVFCSTGGKLVGDSCTDCSDMRQITRRSGIRVAQMPL